MRYALILTVLATCMVYGAEPVPDAAAMQAAMQKMSTTGVEHAALAKAVGEWDVQSSMWMAPAAPAMSSKGTATFTLVLEGKWLRQEFKGEMMNKPYMGIGLSGYDALSKVYVATWFDNFSTGMQPMTGTSTDNGKTITYTSEMPLCPMTGGSVNMRSVLVADSADKMTFTMYSTPKGQSEHKSMELIYTRKNLAK